MINKIIDIENKIIENKREYIRLQDELIQEYYNFLESKGIKKGSLVEVKSFSRVEKGIFSNLFYQYDRVRPKIMKVKKDGTAHASAFLYCYEIKDIVGIE